MASNSSKNNGNWKDNNGSDSQSGVHTVRLDWQLEDWGERGSPPTLIEQYPDPLPI